MYNVLVTPIVQSFITPPGHSYDSMSAVAILINDYQIKKKWNLAPKTF